MEKRVEGLENMTNNAPFSQYMPNDIQEAYTILNAWYGFGLVKKQGGYLTIGHEVKTVTISEIENGFRISFDVGTEYKNRTKQCIKNCLRLMGCTAGMRHDENGWNIDGVEFERFFSISFTKK